MPLRRERQGRQHQGANSTRRQSVRGAALTGISHAADEGALLRRIVSEGHRKTWISSLPAAIVESERVLHEPRRPQTPAVRILRVLRALCLRALREGKSTNGHPAGSAQQIKL